MSAGRDQSLGAFIACQVGCKWGRIGHLMAYVLSVPLGFSEKHQNLGQDYMEDLLPQHPSSTPSCCVTLGRLLSLSIS